MLWNLKYNNKEAKDREESIKKQSKNEGKEPPKWLLDKRKSRPELGFGLNFYYNAFFDIGSGRPPSKTVWNISWFDIQRYVDHYELDFEQGEKLHFIIRKMDDAYIEYMGEKNGKPKPNKPEQSREPVTKRTKPNSGKK